LSATAKQRMTADEFIAWAMEQPEGTHYELVAGEVVAMAPERAVHGRTKLRFARRFAEAIEAAHLSCEVFGEGMTVRVDATTLYEPGAMVRCGPPLDDNATETSDPLIVIEVVSPSSHKRDTGGKLEDYFRLPSVRHYLIVKTENQVIIHHQRNEAGDISTRIIRDGTIRLDPPGLALTDLFPPPT
jgi:Uma2 family endonuclease